MGSAHAPQRWLESENFGELSRARSPLIRTRYAKSFLEASEVAQSYCQTAEDRTDAPQAKAM